jgi:hypothetical protein
MRPTDLGDLLRVAELEFDNPYLWVFQDVLHGLALAVREAN